MADLRDELLPVRHQGHRPACLAFATSTAHEHRHNHDKPLSVEHLFFHAVCRTPGANPNAGTTMAGTATALNEEGQPFESAWAYERIQCYRPRWSPPTELGPLSRAIMSVKALSIDVICDLLDARHVVVLGLVITDAFWSPDIEGIVSIRSPDLERGGHAILAVGHGRDDIGNQLILVRNSWGDRWGLGGHAWLYESYVTRQLHQTALVE